MSVVIIRILILIVCGCFFFLAPRPKDPGPNTCGLIDWAWFIAAKWAVYKPSGAQVKGCNTYTLTSKNICIEQQEKKQQKEKQCNREKAHNDC